MVLLGVALLAATLLAFPANAADRTIVISASGTAWHPSGPITVAPGDNVTFILYNNDSFAHSFIVEGHGVDIAPWVGPGVSRTTTITAGAEGTYDIYCGVSGHRTSMTVDLVVSTGSIPPKKTPGPELILVAFTLFALVAAIRLSRRK